MMMYKGLNLKIAMVLLMAFLALNISTTAVQANELIEPSIADYKTSSIVGWKQYFLNDNNGKERITIKDYSSGIPIISFEKEDNFVTLLPDSETKNNLLTRVEYTKFGLTKFTDQGIIITDNNNKKVSLSYPVKIQFTEYMKNNFYRVIQTASDGEEVFFIMKENLYLLSTQNKKITLLTKLKDYHDDLVYIAISGNGNDYKLITVSEGFGEPHLGYQGHAILIEKDKMVRYWRNKAYVFYHDQEIKSAIYPVMHNGSLLIPIKQAAGPLGLEYQFDREEEQLSLTKGNLNAKMTVGSNTAQVNNETFTMSTQVILVDGEVMVPLRFICDEFGFKNKLEYDFERELPTGVSRISKVLIF